MRYPLVLPAVALAAGIGLGIFHHFNSTLNEWLLAGAWLAACAAFLLKHPGWCYSHIISGFVLAGALLGARANAGAVETPMGALFDGHLAANEYAMFAVVDATLHADAMHGPDGIVLQLEVDQIAFGGHRRPTSGGLALGVGGSIAAAPVEEWRQGRRVRVPATLRRPAKFLDPGAGDSQRAYGWRGISLVGSTKSPRLVELIGPASWTDECFSEMRWRIRRSVLRNVAPWNRQSSAVVSAILIGDRAGLDAEMVQQLQEAGTYHVIAISGGNIAILAALCVFVVRFLRIGPRGSAMIVISVLVFYAGLVGAGGGASVGRATLMATIYFFAQCFDQRSEAGNVAALAAVLLFCAMPLEVVDASFALTFGATVGLILGMSKLKRPEWMPRFVFAAVALLAASICAEIALLPVSAFVFSRVTAAGLLLNFAAIPLMTAVQIGGMAVVAVDQINHHAASWVGFIPHLGVRWLLASASLVDAMRWTVRRVPPPAAWVIWAYYGSLVLVMFVSGFRRFVVAAVASTCGVLMVTTLSLSFRPADRRLRVTFLDVGQGDAAVAQLPDGRTLGIDAGGITGTNFDIGGRVVAPAYWALGIGRLDVMAISHSDPDHIGGAASVFRDFRPREIWEGVPVPRHEPTRVLRALVKDAHVRWRNVHENDRFTFGEVEVVVRHPPSPDWERQKVRNNDSEVLEFRLGEVSFVFTGDIGREVERDISSAFSPAGIRILKVPHHGSATSSSAEFLRALRPSIAIISAGRGNPFGHPTPAVLARYQDVGAAIFRTDLDGAITVSTDGKTVEVRSFTGRTLTLQSKR